MDQKNTIVKCYANPNCLFNHNGVCDNYVISIGADGSCQEYVETISEEQMQNGAIGTFKGYSITKPNEPIQLNMTIAEFDKITKNKNVVSDWYYAATLDTCKTCKKVVYGQPCQYKNVINGVWTCYEEEIDEI